MINGGFKETLKVWSSDTSRQDVRELASDHEEADTRIVQVEGTSKSTFCVEIRTFLSSFCTFYWVYINVTVQPRFHAAGARA